MMLVASGISVLEGKPVGEGGGVAGLLTKAMDFKPRLHGDCDPDPDPDWLRLHGGKLDSSLDSDHLSHVDCDPDSNPDSGPGARVNTPLVIYLVCGEFWFVILKVHSLGWGQGRELTNLGVGGTLGGSSPCPPPP